MANARTTAVSAEITNVLYELRDTSATNYSATELLAYFNKVYEEIYMFLVDKRSELIRTGTGSLSTVAGTQSYDLSANSMGDLWVPHRIWITNYEPMSECEEWDLWDARNAEEQGDTSRSQPEDYCLVGDYIWFKDVPDAVYTVNFLYFPNFVPLASTDNMPLKNLFNLEIKEGAKAVAKHRNDQGVNIDVILKDIYRDKALKVIRRRERKPVRLVPRIR